MGKTRKNDETYSPEEARRRFEAALKAGLSTPATPHEEMKLGKRKTAKPKSPTKTKKKSG